MDSTQQNKLFNGALSLLKKEGTRFSVDDLSASIHISKKTIYAFTPSKEDLARWLYTKAFDDFENKLKDASKNSDKLGNFFFPMLESYADLLSITQDDTFNRYSLSIDIEKKAKQNMLIARQDFWTFLKNTPLKKYCSSPSFFPSIEASLLHFSTNKDENFLIKDYSLLLANSLC
jgi:AcrR family transcriptional regulator